MTTHLTIRELQREIYTNKVRRGFNVTSIGKEIIHLTEEIGELARAYRDKNREDTIDAIIDIIIYSLGLLEILKVDGDRELRQVIERNKKRNYRNRGVTTEHK